MFKTEKEYFGFYRIKWVIALVEFTQYRVHYSVNLGFPVVITLRVMTHLLHLRKKG